ncbi:MsnO8 family LLM class oxidoreductase [Neorhizobium sp. T786]|uniref:MsnO8 family LLM class oxidoreductase n=1 Tax=Pseudorhizobium xiangyangii TaxID=2883104 RepID=UPI001CFF5F55|nr:MsnO8 family LLM class oxidoreductase [Neorhizobium xiangyangii]MCB5205124.1 MsnO8 family LLM class oxidoreductase [Neorhizobium xiangyangii]
MKLSIVDSLEHAPGKTSAETIQDCLALARHAEAVGVHRYWVVEHHNVAFEACPSPEIMVAVLAGATSRMRIGTGGILLNNYSPYKVAEQARTLAALYPGRIDIGFGRSISGVGPDLALKRDREAVRGDDQATLVEELVGWLSGAPHEDGPFTGMAIMPDMPGGPEPWNLAGSATSGALTGRLGLSLACSGFHRPELVPEVCAAYREALATAHPGRSPQIMLALKGAVAETREEAERLFLPLRLVNAGRRTGGIFPPFLPTVEEALAQCGGSVPPVDALSTRFTTMSVEELRAHMKSMMAENGVTELLFRLGLADPVAKRKMVSLLVEAVADL